MRKLLCTVMCVMLSFSVVTPVFASQSRMADVQPGLWTDCYDWAVANYDDSLWDMPEYDRYNYIVDYVTTHIELMSNEEIIANPVHVDPATGRGDTFSITACIAELSKLAGLDAASTSFDVYDHREGIITVNISGTTYYTNPTRYILGDSNYKCSTSIWSDHRDGNVYTGPVYGEDEKCGGTGVLAKDLY